MRPLRVAVVALLLAGCSTSATPAPPGIGPRTAVAPEHRSTCEALGRADLAVVGTDPSLLARTATALADAAARAPREVRPPLVRLAGGFDAAVAKPATAARLVDDPARSIVVAWVNTHCGGTR